MMCGPSGSGKSTYARRLEDEGMVRLSYDAEVWRRGIRTFPAPQPVLDEIDADLRTQLVDLVMAGRDVVLDFSFATRSLRQEFRDLLAPTGVEPETVFMATDRATVLARVRARGGDHADDVVLTDEVAARHHDDFEPPTPDEGPLLVIGP